ncbi:MAG: hypothetical protein L6R38_009639 [Xanthoria sp. 2 TBL-2021]|nr:MAG: hypothetical protein L6R38_009639 [Xanthoria sp. 2 TBL-2021]
MLVRQAAQNFLALFLVTVLFQTTYALPTELLDFGEVSELDKRQGPTRGGIQIETGACYGRQLETIRNAVQDASYLAAAGLSAASNFRQVPFTYFFKNDLNTAKDVGAVLQRVIDAQKGLGDPIYVTCQDRYERCGPTNAGYTAQFLKEPAGSPGSSPIIVACPVGLSLNRNPRPCTARAGAISLGWLMLHQMVIVKSIAGPTWPIVDIPGREMASEVRGKLVYDEDTTKLADAYAHLGSWSYDLGLGYEPWHQDKNCLDKFWIGQFDLKGLDATNPAS